MTLNGEQGASTICTIEPVFAFMVFPDEPLAALEDVLLAVHHAVGRQPALALPQAHRPARRVQPHADCLRGFDLVIEEEPFGKR